MLTVLLALQIQVADPSVYHGRDGRTAARPPVIESVIAIDGVLDEAPWRSAALLTGFSLYQPIDGRPAPDSTDVLVWYSSTALHFGIRAYESHATVRATLADRDRVSGDDNVEIHLDTFDERKRAFVFIVNPLGVQADGTKNDGGGFIPGSNVMPGQNDLSADYQWQSKGRVTEAGYEIEVRIPFSSLRYASGSEQRWGLQIVRNVSHSGYQQTWTPARRASASFIAQAGTMEGLRGMQHGQVVELNPELTNTVKGAPCCAPSNREWKYDGDPQLGGNVRWGMGSNWVLNGTIKPDFSQVEADAAQIAADERFALFYPERRPFFVEGAEQFNVPNSLVYTRRIVQPAGAAKITGKIGGTDVAVLSAFDDGSTTSTGDRPIVDIVRLRRALGEQSTVGLLYSDRASDARTNRVAGADLRWVFDRIYYAQFQLMGSSTEANGATSKGPMFDAVVDRTGKYFGFHYSVIGVSDEFRTDNGFLPRTGYVQPNIANRFTWYGAQGRRFERYNVFASATGLWNYDDFFAGKSLLEQRLNMMNELVFRGGWSLSITPTLARYRFEPTRYTFTPSEKVSTALVGARFNTRRFRKGSASIGTSIGNDVDFLETSPVRRIDYNASVDLVPTNRLRVSATYLASSFTRRSDDERTLSTRIPRLRLEYQVARPLFVRVVSQYEAARRAVLREPVTGVPLAGSAARASNLLRADWLISYRPKPGTVLFVGYGNSLTEPDALALRDLRRTSDAFFVKASYLWRAR